MSSLPPFFQFVNTSLPDYLKRLNTPLLLLQDDKEPVKSLEKQAALKVVESALDDPIKRQELEDLVKENPPEQFSRLIFKQSSAITYFILEHLDLGLEVYILLYPTHFRLKLNETRFGKTFPAGQAPEEFIWRVIDILIRKAPQTVFFCMPDDAPNVDEILKRILNLTTKRANRFIVIRFFKMDGRIILKFSTDLSEE